MFTNLQSVFQVILNHDFGVTIYQLFRSWLTVVFRGLLNVWSTSGDVLHQLIDRFISATHVIPRYWANRNSQVLGQGLCTRYQSISWFPMFKRLLCFLIRELDSAWYPLTVHNDSSLTFSSTYWRNPEPEMWCFCFKRTEIDIFYVVDR